MTATTHTLASGPGWRVSDVVCTAGAGDRPFEETHQDFCVAAVTSGTFRYRAQQGTAMLAPGALLLGNPGTCYECGHEHGSGDRCLSFHFGPAYMERIIAGVPGARKLAFEAARLPPLPALAPLLAEVEAARDMADDDAFEELSLRIAGASVAAVVGAGHIRHAPSRRDQKRVAEAVRRIELDAEGPVSLSALANETATSPYHFLRIFRQVAGMTP
jgi:AraC family transcriptional regulator